MDATKIKINRKNGRHLRVPVTPIEEKKIKEKAALSGLSIAEYLRRLGLGFTIHGLIDQQHILQLAKINGDLGRLGGLLKLWLTQDERVAHFSVQIIVALLNSIRETQTALYDVVKKL